MGQSYKGLSALLFVLAVLEAAAGLVLIFGSNWVLSMVPAGLPVAGTAFLTIFMKAVGLFALGFGYLLCVTAREPARYVSVIDTLIFVLLASGFLIGYALGVMHIGQYFPGNYIVIRIIIQVILAVALIMMRPKAAAARA
jgi:hypothetical protein